MVKVSCHDQHILFLLNSNKYFTVLIPFLLNIPSLTSLPYSCIMPHDSVTDHSGMLSISAELKTRTKSIINLLKLIHRDISSAYFFLIVDLRERGMPVCFDLFHKTLFYRPNYFGNYS